MTRILNRLRDVNERILPTRLAFPPEWLVLGVNSFCNLKCRMCDVGTGNTGTNFGGNLTGAQTRSMPVDLFAHILDQRQRYAPRSKVGLAFTEPLAWPHLAEALALARTRGVTLALTTNGLLLPRHADLLAESELSSLFLSLDGPQDIHNHIRGHEDSFQRAMEGLTRLARSPKAPPVKVACTVSSWNVGHLSTLARALRTAVQSGVPIESLIIGHNSFITEAMAMTHNAIHGEMLPATASNVFASDIAAIDLDLLSEDLQALTALDLPFQLTIQPAHTSREDLEHYYRDHHRPVGRRCRDVHRMLMIDPDGEAIPTHGRCFRMPVGNIKDTNLAALWNAPSLQSLRKVLARAGGLLPACSRCCSAYS